MDRASRHTHRLAGGNELPIMGLPVLGRQPDAVQQRQESATRNRSRHEKPDHQHRPVVGEAVRQVGGRRGHRLRRDGGGGGACKAAGVRSNGPSSPPTHHGEHLAAARKQARAHKRQPRGRGGGSEVSAR